MRETSARPEAGGPVKLAQLLVVETLGAPTLDELVSRTAALTPTEREVLRGLRKEGSPTAVAEVRHCEVSTVRKHLENARRKLDCHRSNDAALILHLAETRAPGHPPTVA